MDLAPDIAVICRTELIGYAISLFVGACVVIPLYIYYVSVDENNWKELFQLLNLVVSVSSLPMYGYTLSMAQTINRIVFDCRIDIAKGLLTQQRAVSLYATRTRKGIGIHWIFVSDFLQTLYVLLLMFDSIPSCLTVLIYQWCLKFVRILIQFYEF